MADVLAIDYAWQHPQPASIAKAGVHGVMRYLSHDPTKDLTKAEASALHKAGLWVGVVFETDAKRAAGGHAAGVVDAVEANKHADALGYPKDAVIFYACDFDANGNTVMPYYDGIAETCNAHKLRPFGVYGSSKVVTAVRIKHPHYYIWQTSAWSGTHVYNAAHLYQRQHTTIKIVGAAGGWDENVVLHNFPVWTAKATPVPVPPHPANPDHVLWEAAQAWARAKGLL